MKYFQNINTPYVAPVDLETLGRTYTALETMHQEAVKGSSELKQAIANLELNEAEDGFRNQLFLDVERTIDENTKFGNLAAAYDDIVKLSGDIVANPALIGRLKAQKEYLAYQTKIDQMDMPDDYKQYFKEKNPYYYADIKDNQGRITGGTPWKPVSSPTKIVNLDDIIKKGIDRAAEESGGGQITRWLDKDGNITTDPKKAWDGEVYNATTYQYEKLGHDKIYKSIMAVIESTPGAKESLDQDYDIALWKHNKNSSSNELTVSDITDENGIILSREDYLFKRIDPSAQVAAYNNRVDRTTYGEGLNTYLKAKYAPSPTEGNGGQNTYNILDSGFRGDPITFTYNKGESANTMKNNLVYSIKETLSSFGIDVEGINENNIAQAIDLIPDTYNGTPTHTIKDTLNYQLMLLEEAKYNLDAIKTTMSDEEKTEYEFALDMQDGGKVKKDRTVYDNHTINAINQLYGKGKKVVISFDNSTELNSFLELFSKTTDFKNLGIDVGEKSITVDSDNKQILPLVASKAKNYNRKSKGLLSKAFTRENAYTITVFDEKGNDVTDIVSNSEGLPVNVSKEHFIGLGNMYNRSQKILEKYDDKYDISDKDLTVSNIDIHGDTYTDYYTTNLFNLGLMEMTDKKRIDDNSHSVIENSLFNFDTTQYDVYTNKGKITDAKKLTTLKHLFRNAINEKRLSFTSSLVPGIVDKHSGLQGGYTITVFPQKDAAKKGLSTDTQQYYIPGLGEESYLKMLNQDPVFNAANTLDILNETLQTKFLSTSRTNPEIGNIKLTGIGNSTYICDFNGDKIQLNKKDAVNLITNLKDFNTIKNYLKVRDLNVEEFLNSNERATNSLNNIVINLANIMGYTNEIVGNILLNDLQN